MGGIYDMSRTLGLVRRANYERTLHEIGREGVKQLSKYTPKDSGDTASKWYYKIKRVASGAEVVWCNSELISGGVPLVMLLEYGHSMPDGTYWQGEEFLGPAMQETLDKHLSTLWKEAMGRV